MSTTGDPTGGDEVGRELDRLYAELNKLRSENENLRLEHIRNGRQILEHIKSAQSARQCARVLAHSYDHDATPPDWALELARSWDARGRPIATATTEPPPASSPQIPKEDAASEARIAAVLGPMRYKATTPEQLRINRAALLMAAVRMAIIHCEQRDALAMKVRPDGWIPNVDILEELGGVCPLRYEAGELEETLAELEQIGELERSEQAMRVRRNRDEVSP